MNENVSKSEVVEHEPTPDEALGEVVKAQAELAVLQSELEAQAREQEGFMAKLRATTVKMEAINIRIERALSSAVSVLGGK